MVIISTLHNSATYYSPSLLATLRTIITDLASRGGSNGKPPQLSASRQIPSSSTSSPPPVGVSLELGSEPRSQAKNKSVEQNSISNLT